MTAGKCAVTAALPDGTRDAQARQLTLSLTGARLWESREWVSLNSLASPPTRGAIMVMSRDSSEWRDGPEQRYNLSLRSLYPWLSN
jgi:hypothetical protein